jgi:hypothetical protein
MKLTSIIKEIRYPAAVDDLTMSFLYTGINSAAEKILKDIKKRTGSNANPISLQVIESIAAVNKLLMKKMKLKGQESLSYFLKVALKEFNTDAPFISSLFKRYRLKERDYR